MRNVTEPAAPTAFDVDADDPFAASADSLIPLETAEQFIRVVRASERPLLADVLIPAAVRQWEEWTGRALLSRQVEHQVKLGRWERHAELPERYRLPLQPVVSLDGVWVRDCDGEEEVTDTDLFQLLENDALVLLKDRESWPYTASERRYLRWRWTAGYAEAGDVPANYKHTIYLLAGLFYENRDLVVGGQGASVTELPGPVSELIDSQSVLL